MKEREERHCPPEFGGPATPWLVYPNGNSIKSHTFCNVLEPNKNCIKRIPEMRRKFCYGFSHGWLVLIDLGLGGCCYLWNPISLETIYLPDLKLKNEDDFQLISCTLSSAPTDPSCMVLFFCSIPLIIYCQPGDTQWTWQFFETEDRCIDHAVGFCDGTMYACTGKNNIMIIRRNTSGCLSLRLLNVEQPECPPDTKRSWLYSLESCGELFRVYLYFSGTEAVNCIGVFKLDSSQMSWVKVDDLGGQVFFLTPNDRSCASCSADKQSGLEGDCIYFTYPDDKGLYVFEMKDNSISVSLPCPDLRRPWCDPFWYIPMTNNRIVDTTKDNVKRTVIDGKKMMVKQSPNEMSKEEEEEKVKPILSLFFNLPKELQHMIPTHLTSAVDYMNFRAACKSLRSIAPPIQWSFPWLMGVQKGVGFFLDPECNSIYRMNIPELFGCTIRFSKDGWLLVSKGNFSMFFFDPFTKMRIEIPDMTEYYCFEGVCFSSLPTSSDCVIFGFGLSGPESVLMGWYRLGQENWSYYEVDIIGEYAPFSLSRSNPVFYDGGVYFLSLEGRLGAFDFNGKWTVHEVPLPCCSRSQTYMVECDGDLLSVFISEGGNITIVSRFDRTMMCWVEVKSLSGKTLFVSPSTSMAIETQEKRLQNKVFLPRVWSKKKNDIVFYSLETEKYHSFSSSSFSSCDFYGTKEQLFSCWIQPNLVWRNIS